MRYFIKNGLLRMFRKGSGIPRKGFKLVGNEIKYIDNFIYYYDRLNLIDRKKIDLMRPKYSLYRCWYYCKVWYYTRENVGFNKKNECIDHILPISRGFKNNINPESIGSIENIQYLTHKANLNKGTKLTEKGKELLHIFTTQ